MVRREYKILVAISVVLIISTVLYQLSLVKGELSLYNDGFNGASKLYRLVDIDVILDDGFIENLDPLDTAIIMPLLKPVGEEAYSILDYVYKGGMAIILDEHGFSNQLLSKAGYDVGVMNTTILDEIFKNSSRYYPLALNIYPKTMVEYILLNKPSYIYIRSRAKYVRVIAVTSNYSYADMDGDGYYSFGEPIKSFIVGVSIRYGRGSIVLFSDKDVFSNSVLDYRGNIEFLKQLVGKRKLYYCILYIDTPFIDYIRYYIDFSTKRRFSNIVYELTIYVFGLAFSMVFAYAITRKVGE